MKQKADRFASGAQQFKKETGINPADGPKSMKRFSTWAQNGGGSGGSTVATANAKPQQQQAAASPPAASAASTTAPQYTEKKKRRTLLSGQQSLSQPYGESTILGA